MKNKIKKFLVKGNLSNQDNRKNAGITLIALVITIIILLILAGVAIAQLSNNGLFDKSKQAKEESENAIEKEETELAKYENEVNNYFDGTIEDYIDSTRGPSTFTCLYNGVISQCKSYTLSDSIEKFERLVFLTGNPSNGFWNNQIIVYTYFLKNNYGDTQHTMQLNGYSNCAWTYHFKNASTFVLDWLAEAGNNQLMGIYGVN